MKIAVCHSPDGLCWLRGKGVHLLMCGHTHGGHVALPGGMPVVMPSPMGRLYPSGLQIDGPRSSSPAAWAGAWCPFRTWAPPDVAVFTVT